MFCTISRCKPVFLSMAIWVCFLAFPLNQVSAGIVATVNCVSEHMKFREKALSLLARTEIRTALLQHGIDPSEAEARIKALTDEEVLQISDKANELAIGGNRNISDHQATYGYTSGQFLLICATFALAVGIILILIHYIFDWPRSRWDARRYSPQEAEPPLRTDQTEPAAMPGGKAQ